jgi:hypothetical protein
VKITISEREIQAAIADEIKGGAVQVSPWPSWCAEGRKLVLARKGVEAARRRIERETMVQADLFGREIRQ